MLSRALSSLLEVLSPPRCGLCLQLNRAAFCDECEKDLHPLPIGSCPRCGLGQAGRCPACAGIPSVDFMRGAVDYAGAGGRAVRLLKFNRTLELGQPMGKKLRELQDSLPQIDVIVPVPIHWRRRAFRGFNQAEILCESLSAAPVSTTLLRRRKNTKPQTRLTGAARLTNLRGAIVAVPCHGSRVLLVDDVKTSGGTLEACASALKAAGASWVGALVYAHELPASLREGSP